MTFLVSYHFCANVSFYQEFPFIQKREGTSTPLTAIFHRLKSIKQFGIGSQKIFVLKFISAVLSVFPINMHILTQENTGYCCTCPTCTCIITLKAPITTKFVCFSRLLKCLRSLFGKQCGPRSDWSYRSSLFWVQTVCFYT